MVFPPTKVRIYAGSITPDHEVKIPRAFKLCT
jgi:hypothetical protein